MNTTESNTLPPGPVWQQIAAFLLWKFAQRERVEVTTSDVDAFMAAFNPSIPVVFVDQRAGRFAVQLLSEAEAMEITKQGAAIEHVGGEPEAPGSASLQ
jgi:hypothetical protein